MPADGVFLPSRLGPSRRAGAPATRIALLLSALAGAVVAADPPPTDPGATVAPAAPASAPVPIEQLLLELPSGVPSIQRRDDSVWWDDGKGVAYRFVPVEFRADPLLETPLGAVAIDGHLIAENRTDVLAALPALIAQAQAAHLPASTLEIVDSILAGVYLRAPKSKVLAEGVLDQVGVPAPPRAADLQAAVAAAAAAVNEQLAHAPLSDPARAATADLLLRLSWGRDHPVPADELSGEGARALLEDDYLARSGCIADAQASILEPLVHQLRTAIARAAQLQPVVAYRGRDAQHPLAITQLRNAFGDEGWVLQSPRRCRYTRLAPAPLFHWQPPELSLVVELPPGSDPTGPASGVLGASLWNDRQRLATWSLHGGFAADLDHWRLLMPGRGKASGRDVVSDFVPPAIPVIDLANHLSALAVPGGLLRPPQARTPEEAQRFEGDCAQLLPDAAYLDLLGEYLLRPIYPSADAHHPAAIGTRLVHGGRTRTAEELLQGCSGGRLLGDAAELAGLYQVIEARQGRSAFVMRMPATDVCVSAERQEDGRWHSYVLQAGPAYEFIDQDLPGALARATAAFGTSEPFDGDALPVLLRLDGEARPTPCALSWRIFAEPEYARAMLEVESAVHAHAYARALRLVGKLMADHDDGPANQRQQAALELATAQPEAAAQTLERTIGSTLDPVARVEAAILRVRALIDAGHLDQARTQANDLLDRLLPPARERLGLTVVGAGARLAEVLSTHPAELGEAAERTVRECMLGTDKSHRMMPYTIQWLGEWLDDAGEYDQQTWQESSRYRLLRRLTHTFARTGILVLGASGHQALQKDATLRDIASSVGDWFNRIAFRDADTRGEIMARYAEAGAYYEAMFGRDTFMRMLQDKPVAPESGQYDHAARIGGPGQVAFDLPWIQISVPYWTSRLRELIARTVVQPDAEDAARFGRQLENAELACQRLGYSDPRLEDDYHVGRLIAALLTQDVDVVKERLHAVAESEDPHQRAATAALIGESARLLPLLKPDWLAQVVTIWLEETHDVNCCLEIAWGAARAPMDAKSAVQVAEMAADKLKDRSTVQDEIDLLRRVVGIPAQP